MYHPSIRNFSVIRKTRSVHKALALVFLLGPLGLFYIDPFGGFSTFTILLIGCLLSPIAAILFTWILCLIWAVVAIKRINERVKMFGGYFKG